MFDYVSVLQKNPNGVLATQDKEKVKTRVFQYLFADNNKVYFCTSNEKPVYNQLQESSFVSFCTYPPNFGMVVSVNGNAVFVEDNELKKRALDENPGIKAIYKSYDNPVFKIFYIDVKEVETFSSSEGAKTYKL